MERVVYGAPFAAAVLSHVFLLVLLLRSARKTRNSWLLFVGSGSTAAGATALTLGVGGLSGLAGATTELAITGVWAAFAISVLYERAWNRYFVRAICVVAVLSSAIQFGSAAALPFVDGWAAVSITIIGLYARIALAVVGLLATENLYRNTPPEYRWNIKLLCIALAGMFAYTVFIYADALLFRRVSAPFWAGRGVVMAFAAPLLAVAAARNRDWAIDIHVSRRIAFHSATLVASGVFLVALAAIGEVFRTIGPGWGDVAELILVIGGVACVAVLTSSGAARSRLRGLIADHFYSTRYDYREEWLKSTEILSGDTNGDPVQTRVIKAVAEVVDSPRGVLWVRENEGTTFNWAGSWNQPGSSMHEAADGDFAALFRGGEWIVELDQTPIIPRWCGELIDPWIAVPLSDKRELIGFVVLSRSRAPLSLERENFDLLRIVAKQAAIHIAEQRNAKALVQSKELDKFAKRFAFVAHDVKNVSSQLAMILHNARLHGDDPLFQKDVLATVQAAHDRIKKLISGLSSTQAPPVVGAILPIDLVREQVATIGRRRGNDIIELQHDGRSASVAMDPDDFRSVITHLCENAIETSPGKVQIRVHHRPMLVEIDVVDGGSGMSAEFIRDKLFEPFGSTKREGMGIGAYQSRELVRGAGGDLLAISEPGVGTTMRILLPSIGVAAGAELLESEGVR